MVKCGHEYFGFRWSRPSSYSSALRTVEVVQELPHHISGRAVLSAKFYVEANDNNGGSVQSGSLVSGLLLSKPEGNLLVQNDTTRSSI